MQISYLTIRAQFAYNSWAQVSKVRLPDRAGIFREPPTMTTGMINSTRLGPTRAAPFVLLRPGLNRISFSTLNWLGRSFNKISLN